MDNNKSLTVEETFKIAVKKHQEGKTDIAQEYYNQVLKINSNHLPTLSNLGVIFGQLGENQKAISCYEKVIEINPNYIDAYNNLGVIFKILGENKKAISCYEKVIEINPNYLKAHNELGKIFYELEEYKKAKRCCEKIIEINPNDIEAHNNLGTIFYYLEEYKKAIECCGKVLEINPNNQQSINLLSVILSQFRFNYKFLDDTSKLKNLFIFLFKKNNIKHSNISVNVKPLLLTNCEQNQLLEAINSQALLENEVSQNLIKEELFHLMLQKAIIPDEFLEKLLTQLRYELLSNLSNSNKYNLNEHLIFIISLAEQCWLNEYIYIQSEKENSLINKLKDKIEKNKKINELEVSILSCYIKLNSSKNITEKLLVHKSKNILFNNLITTQIQEPIREKELAKSITSFDVINNIISKEVRQQYEENPYPRWKFTNQKTPNNFFYWINTEIKPNRVDLNNKFNNPDILIAGCGTGIHSTQSAKYSNSNILAIDLSLSSLAYSKRKTEELNYKNFEYMHADILQLDKLNRKFDIIECVGTLHHMKNPIQGLKELLDVLEPHGFLKLGLYSETARQNVVKARELIKKRNYKNTTKDIKKFRQDVFDKRVDPLTQKVNTFLDFYSTSMVRDLLFHVQEHRFTIPKISKILKDFNLEFLGFISVSSEIKKEYLKNFPKDKKYTSLYNWHEFEKKKPDTFVGMYQFWVRKL